MAVSAERSSTIIFTGDVTGTETASAAKNISSPGTIEVKTLGSGANTITVPTGGTIPSAVTIIPPAGNTVTLTLKGVTGDTGVALHLTDPTIVALATSVSTFCLTTNNILTGIRFIWS
jgi:hypothetical protein